MRQYGWLGLVLVANNFWLPVSFAQSEGAAGAVGNALPAQAAPRDDVAQDIESSSSTAPADGTAGEGTGTATSSAASEAAASSEKKPPADQSTSSASSVAQQQSGGGTTQTSSSSTAKSSTARSSAASSALLNISSTQSSAVFVVSSVRSSAGLLEPSRSSAISKLSSSSQSSAESSVVAAETDEPAPPSIFDRENFGYTVPVIDPSAIVSPAEFDLSNEAVTGNLLLAILVALVMGTSGIILSRLIASNEPVVKKILDRLPLQAILTILLFWIIDVIAPDVSAQGFDVTTVSLMRIPLYAAVFFLVVGTSNFMFNNMLNAESEKFGTWIANNPLRGKAWFIVLLIIGYGLIGAHINPDFSMFPGRQLGIVIITALSIILSACLKDVVLYLMSKKWDMPGWFRANIAGFSIALVCIVLSRALNLSPGYIYGIPVGLLILSNIYREREGYFEFLSIVWVLLLAVIVWVAGSFVTQHEVLTDILNLFFVILIEDAFFEMLPLPYLAGGTIFRWRKVAWAVQFVTVVFFLFHTLFNPHGTVANLAQEPPAAATLMLLGCYATGVLLLWGYVLWRRRFDVDKSDDTLHA